MFSFFMRWILGDEIEKNTIKHASKGEYTKTNRLKGGGHGQEAIEYMDKNNIQYTITKTYPNGVRIGNVPHHAHIRKRTGDNQSWFPKKWNREIIQKAGKCVSRGKKYKDGVTKSGKYKNVKVGIIRTHGKIATIFPLKEQNNFRRKR